MLDKRIIYIAGYGRSGSTLIERILSNHDQIKGCGELMWLIPQLNSDKACSCGEPFDRCSFWQPIKQFIDDNPELKKYESLRIQNEGFISLFTHTSKEYKNIHNHLLKNIVEDSFENYIIDSSKSAWEATFRPLRVNEAFPVKILHVVRDGRACLWSNIKGDNTKMVFGQNAKMSFPFFKTLINWFSSNIIVHYLKWKIGSENYLLVRYEDFTKNPNDELRKIGKFLNLNFDSQIEKIGSNESFPIIHQIFGNRLSRIKNIKIQFQEEWKKKLPKHLNYSFLFLNYFLLEKYGYTKNENTKIK